MDWSDVNTIKITALVGATFTRPIVSSLIFEQPMDFSNAVFEQAVDFSNAVFKHNVSFKNATFKKEAKFNKSEFAAKANFFAAAFLEQAVFKGAKFLSRAEFFQTKFSSEVVFSDTSFSARADFKETLFSAAADFSEAKLMGTTTFLSTKFMAGAVFRETTVSGKATFHGAHLENSKFTNAMFEDANFDGCNLQNSDFNGVDLTGFKNIFRAMGNPVTPVPKFPTLCVDGSSASGYIPKRCTEMILCRSLRASAKVSPEQGDVGPVIVIRAEDARFAKDVVAAMRRNPEEAAELVEERFERLAQGPAVSFDEDSSWLLAVLRELEEAKLSELERAEKQAEEKKGRTDNSEDPKAGTLKAEKTRASHMADADRPKEHEFPPPMPDDAYLKFKARVCTALLSRPTPYTLQGLTAGLRKAWRFSKEDLTRSLHDLDFCLKALEDLDVAVTKDTWLDVVESFMALRDLTIEVGTAVRCILAGWRILIHERTR
jgi:uncharacterized protein YjbI with pentapeptide repeats